MLIAARLVTVGPDPLSRNAESEGREEFRGRVARERGWTAERG